jgi:hypothetical protein
MGLLTKRCNLVHTKNRHHGVNALGPKCNGQLLDLTRLRFTELGIALVAYADWVWFYWPVGCSLTPLGGSHRSRRSKCRRCHCRSDGQARASTS